MSYHYLVEIDLFATQDSIRRGVIQHNLNNISDFRIDYLGCSGDEEEGISDKLLITRLCTQINNVNQFDYILSDFAAYLEIESLPDTYRGDKIPYLGFRQVTIEEVKSYYGQLAGTIGREWFPNGTKLDLSKDEEEELYGTIRALYYYFHIQYQLSADVCEKYEAYMAKREHKMKFTEEQKNKEKEIKTLHEFISGYSTAPEYDFKENGISYGRYAITFSDKDVVIPPYGREMGFETDIKDNAFSDCEIMEKITIYEDIKYFGQGVFENCINLNQAAFYNNMEELPSSTFYTCVSLTEVELPETMKLIGSHAFHGCIAFSDDNFLASTSVEKIKQAAFYGCVGLKSLNLPNTLLEIGASAFTTSGLEKISIPKSVVSIDICAFENCYKLTSIDLSECIDLKEIPSSCFRECRSLQFISLPEGLTQIGNNAFSGCTELKNITIPSTVEDISFDVFKDCSSLESITFLCTDILLDSFDFAKETIVYCKEGSVVHRMAVGMEWSFKLI